MLLTSQRRYFYSILSFYYQALGYIQKELFQLNQPSQILILDYKYCNEKVY